MSTEQMDVVTGEGTTVLVGVKSVPVGDQHLRVAGQSLSREGISHGLDPINEAAVEWALEQRKHGGAERVVAATMGAAGSRDALGRALAMGCDDALLVTDDDLVGGDVRVTAQALAAAARFVGGTVAVFGYESLDGSSGTVPAAVAGLLGWPLVSRMRTGAIRDGTLRAERNVEHGIEVVTVPTPFAVSLVGGAIQPRYPSVRELLAARRRPITVVDAPQLEFVPAAAPCERVVRLEAIPPVHKEPTVVDEAQGADIILALLEEEDVLRG